MRTVHSIIIVTGIAVFTSATFAYGHYLAMTEFWSQFAWHEHLIYKLEIISGFPEHFFATFVGCLTIVVLILFGFYEGYFQTLTQNPRQRITSSGIAIAIITVLAVFNHLLWSAVIFSVLFAIVVMITWLVLAGVVATVHLAGEQQLASVTIGIVIGDLVILWFVGFALDLPSLVIAIIVGSIAGTIAGEAAHRLGLQLIRRDWIIEIPEFRPAW